MNAELITDWDAFRSLEKEWDRLLHATAADSIFLTWDWIDSWRKVCPRPPSPFIITVRDHEGTLCGIAPFYLASLKLLNLFSYRTLRVMADEKTGSEYGDIIILPEQESLVIRAIAGLLEDLAERWDCIWMPRMAGWTGALERMLTLCEKAHLPHRYRHNIFSRIELPETMQQFEDAFSPKRRQQLRRQRRNLLSKPGVSVEICSSEKQLGEFLDRLFELHYRRWQTVGQSGSFRRSPELAAFYRDFIPRAFSKGQLRFMGLAHQGNIESIQIGYVYNNEFLQMQEGFNPAFSNNVGNVLRTEVIGQCIDQGIQSYDFLGGMSEHKRRWGAIERQGYDLFITAARWPCHILTDIGLWPSGRYLKANF